MKKHLIHYDALHQFTEEYLSGLLTKANIVEYERHFREMYEKGKMDKVLVDEICAVLTKNNKTYIMPSSWIDKLPLKITGTPLAYSTDGKQVVHFLTSRCVTSARFKSEKKISFHELVERLSCFEHSSPRHSRLAVMLFLSQVMSRVNFRLSTEPGFGKDSIQDTVGALFDTAMTVEQPTLAKLEMMTYCKSLAVNEAIGIPKAEWELIETYLLSVGAFKNKVTKHSRAFKDTGEVLDTTHFSVSLLYNDINTYPSGTKYFDEKAKASVKDRFPAIRLAGRLTEDFNLLSRQLRKDPVTDNIDWYLDIIHTFHYYRDNLEGELSNYIPPSFLAALPPRWQTNLGRVLKIIDLYSDSQKEFDEWAALLFSCLEDYKAMLKYDKHLLSVARKLGIAKDDFDKEPTLSHLVATTELRAKKDRQYLRATEYLEGVRSALTFLEKNRLLRDFDLETITGNRGLDEW